MSSVHTVYRDGRWVNQVEGHADPVDESFTRRSDAAAAGREIARDLQVRHVVHDLDGTIGAADPQHDDQRGTAG